MEKSEFKKSFSFKILVVGDEGVGKGNFVFRAREDPNKDFIQDREIKGWTNSRGMFLVGNSIIEVYFASLATKGWADLSEGRREIYSSHHDGVIYVFAVNDKKSFKHIEGWVKDVQKQKGKVPSLLVGTKTDLVDERVVSREEGEKLAKKLGFIYYEGSPKGGPLLDSDLLAFHISMMQHRWPEWSPSERIPPQKIPEEKIESQKKKNEHLISLFERHLELERELIQKLRSDQENEDHYEIKMNLEIGINDAELDAGLIQLFIEGLKTDEFFAFSRRYNRLPVIRIYYEYLKKARQLLNDAIVATDDDNLKKWLQRVQIAL